MTTAATADFRAFATDDRPPATSAEVDDREVLVIEPRGRRGLFAGLDKVYFAELVRHRELLAFLVWRDVKVRYKMAALGLLWAAMVPLVTTLIYGLVGAFLGFGADAGAPWLLVMAAGMTPWMFLQKCVSDGGQSLVNNQQLLSKIYLPRFFIPAAACGTAMVDMAMALLIFAGFGVIYAATGSYVPTWNLLAVPLLVPLTFIAGLGTATLLGGVTVLYRDVRFLIPFFAQFGLWLSAVVWPLERLGDKAWVLAINPYAGIVSAWRSALLGEAWYPSLLVGSVVISPLLMVFGLAYFRRVERRFADIA